MKREASQKTLTRRHAINNLDDFEMAVLNLKNIKITKISEQEMFERAAQLDLKELFENARTIPKITQCHFIKLENGSIRTKLYTSQVLSLQDEDTDNTEKNVDNTEVNIEVNCLRVGQIVAVHLRGKKIDMAMFIWQLYVLVNIFFEIVIFKLSAHLIWLLSLHIFCTVSNTILLDTAV